MKQAVARAHANIALVKYWGKRDDRLILPMNGSISMTVDKFYVTTSVTFDQRLTADSLIINGSQAARDDQARVSEFLNLVRKWAKTDERAVIRSVNSVPVASGLASSSAAYAALAKAAALALGMPWSSAELSRLARRGSGSASRSIYGGFVEWLKGSRDDGSDSYAVPLAPPDYWDLVMVIARVDEGKKAISSRDGMRRVVETSLFYAGWLATVDSDLETVREAIGRRDFSALGKTAEMNALKMHATALGADPPFIYWSGATVEVIRRIQRLREEGIEAYVTIDAGPHAAVLCRKADAGAVRAALAEVHGVKEIIATEPGPGVRSVPSL
ncbi:MAG: diphosphomevalonate decarboxylase [Thermaerobacter sp.]|nr:diphosphomevalonate decarboxylase [Thermaerobacter sp.]